MRARVYQNSMNKETNNKLHFVSLGCPKNLVDSEIMLGQLMGQGYSVVEEPAHAETVVINTCGFIDSAKEESIQKILDMGELKEKGGLKKLVVTGCLVQRYKQELVKELPEVDFFIGSGEFQKIASIIDSKSKKKDHFYQPTYLQEDSVPRVNSEPFYRAYLKISEGCLKRCSFCAIPKIRGNLQSRSLSSIVSEAKLLVAGGVREIDIISHDFTDYGWDLRKKNKQAKESPEELLKTLSSIESLDWIRLLYLYPDGITDKMIDLMREKPNLVPYFDMPLQHINDSMLKLMNRKMTSSEIKSILKKIRRKIPSAVIRTQFILGFPGETEEIFEELLDFIREQEFDRVGCFTYSPQSGTTGFKLKQTVSEKTKKERYDRLMDLQREISRKKHKNHVGKTLKVLVEGVSDQSDLLLQGRTSCQAPGIDGVVLINEGQAQVGEMVQVKITDSHDYDLIGHIKT